MTVYESRKPRRIIGLSSDTKPDGHRAGATFYETNTGITYIYTGAAWVVRTGTPSMD